MPKSNLDAKPGRSGIVEKGFQVKYTPPQGGAAIVFETLQDLKIDRLLNGVRLAGWNRSVDENPYWPYLCDSGLGSPWLIPEGVEVSVGDLAVLVQERESGAPNYISFVEQAQATSVHVIDRETSRLCLAPSATLREFLALVAPLLPSVLSRLTELTAMTETALYAARPLHADDVAKAERLAININRELTHGAS